MTEATHANSISRLSSKWRDRVILLVVLAAGTVLTLLAGSSLQQAEALRIKERQTAATQAVASVFQLELTRTTEAVRNAGLMIESNPQLTREQFNRHMQKMVENQLNVNLMEWQPIVPANELAKFEAAARTTEFPDFRVVQPDASAKGWEPVHGRDEYVPVLFFWPEQYRTGGLDMSFSPERMASKLQSRAVRQPVASNVFEFIKEGKVNSGAMAMAISTAVFGADQTVKGYLAAVVDLSTLLQSATRLANAANFDLLVFASTTLTDAPIYAWYGDDSDLKQIATGLRLAIGDDQSATVDFAHQSWRVVLHPRPAFYAKLQGNGSRLAFTAGIGMTLLIMLSLYQSQKSRRKIERAESIASDARRAQELLSQRLQEAQRIAHVGNWQLDVASNKLVWSDELYRVHGLIPGSPAPDYTKSSHLFTSESWERLNAAMFRTVESGAPYELELEIVKPDGSHGWMLARGETVRDASGSVVARRGTATDISERKQLEDQVRQLAFHDALTQLANRRLLDDRLNRAMSASKRSGNYGALMMLDLDNFKPLNDAHGHVAGDLLLIEVARRLNECVRGADTVARVGGDEFVVMLGELDTDKAVSAKIAGEVAEKIHISLAAPYHLTLKEDGPAGSVVQHRCSASIGVALFLGQDASQADVLKWADTAMYQAKVVGRNAIRFYGLPQ